MKHTPLVSIAILNWNGLEDTLSCLASVEKLTYTHLEIIVVDNGSKSEDKAVLSAYPGIVYIDNEENLGFTGGHIVAEAKATGEYIILLNNDLVIDPSWVESCLDTFSRHPKAGFVGGKTFKWDKHNPAYNLENDFYSFQEVDIVTGNTRTLLVGDEERPVDSISGAALMVKRSMLKTTGYLDDIFFCYYEETDLIARALRAGFEAYYTPLAHTWHKIGGSSEGGADGSFYLYQMHRNRYIFAAKNFDDASYKRFRRRYRMQVAKMMYRKLRSGDVESTQRVKAYSWIRSHERQIASSRAKAQQLGESYDNQLGDYRPADVTVVIPCYNYGKYITQAVDSVLEQSVNPKRIIIINDGSKDDSQEVIEKYRGHELIEIINQKNMGVVATKNKALALIRTHWTIFLDADDILDKQYIEATLKRANDDHLDVVYTDMLLFGAIKDIFHAPPYSKFTLLHRNYINNSALLKTSLIKQAGGYSPKMHDGLEDWELYISMIEIGTKPGHLPGALMKYRQHDIGLSRNGEVELKEIFLYQKLISLHPHTFRYLSPMRRRYVRFGIFLMQLIRYPGVWLIILKSTRRAVLAGVSIVIQDARAYFAYKDLR